MAIIEQPLRPGVAADGRTRLFRGLASRVQSRSRSDVREDLNAQPGGTGDEHPIAVTLARTEVELRAATALLELRYASRGYLVSALRPDATSDLTFIADECGATIGTLTLRLDGPTGLRADETYGEHIDAARSQGGRVCELSKFAVAQNARSKPVLGALFGCAYHIGREIREITDVFIEVNPRHVAFYRKVFGFGVAAGERMCPRVLAPSVLLRLEMNAFEARLRELSERARSLWDSRVFMHAPALN